MTRGVKIGEVKMHPSALLAEVEAGEDLVICRGPTPIAHVTRIDSGQDHAALRATLRRERAKQQAATTSELLSWRHEEHARRWRSFPTPADRALDRLNEAAVAEGATPLA